MRDDLTGPRTPVLVWGRHDGEACLRTIDLPQCALDPGAPGGGLAVLAGDAASAAASTERLQPAAGRFVVTPEGVDFIPKFPFIGGTAYSLAVPPCPDFPQGLVLSLEREPGPLAAAAEVAGFYPDVETVPFNLLKVYVYFSEPMAEGAAHRGVHVEDAETGQPLEGVFLHMDPELWDPQRMRLTLLLDPGRIKRGLVPHQEAGYPLTEGAAVKITIGAEFRSAAGAPLRPFSRTYAVGPGLRRPVDPKRWRVDLPFGTSRTPLVIQFDRPLDRAMLDHAFQVLDPEGRPVAGQGAPLPREMGWAFRPAAPWGANKAQVVVSARLEDLAGNSLRRVFDRDLERECDHVTDAEQVVLIAS